MHCKWLNNKVTLHNLNCVTARWQLSGIQFTRCQLCYSRVAIVWDPIYRVAIVWDPIYRVAIVLEPGSNCPGPILLGGNLVPAGWQLSGTQFTGCQLCYSRLAIVRDPIYQESIVFQRGVYLVISVFTRAYRLQDLAVLLVM